MPDDTTIQVTIDPSLLEHVREQLERKKYPIAPDEAITSRVSIILVLLFSQSIGLYNQIADFFYSLDLERPQDLDDSLHTLNDDRPFGWIFAPRFEPSMSGEFFRFDGTRPSQLTALAVHQDCDPHRQRQKPHHDIAVRKTEIQKRH